MSASGRTGWVSRLLLACSLAMLTVPVAHAATGEGESAAAPPKPRAASAAKKESAASAAATAASKAKNKAKAGSTPAEPAKKPVAKPASPPPASAANDGDNMMVKRRKAEPQVDPHVARAYTALKTRQPALAVENYQRALDTNPTLKDAWLGLIHAYISMNDPSSARGALRRLLEIDPKDPQAQMLNIALLGGNPSVQMSELKILLQQQPASGPLWFALGNLQFKDNQLQQARLSFQKAVSAEPQRAEYQFNLAVTLDQLRRDAEAVTAYVRALDLAEGTPVAFEPAQAQRRIAELRTLLTQKRTPEP